MFSPIVRASVLMAIFAGCMAATGCASDASGGSEDEEKPFQLNENSRLAPRVASDEAVVEANSVSFPDTPANREWAKALAPGQVIAGNHDTRTNDLRNSKNKAGFLRKVVSVTFGDMIVIKTERAVLADLGEGVLKISSNANTLFPDAPGSALDGLQPDTRTLRPLSEGDDSHSGNANVNAGNVNPEDKGKNRWTIGGKIDVDMDFDMELRPEFVANIDVRKTWKIPTGINWVKADLYLDPDFRMALTVKALASLESGVSLVEDEFSPTKLSGIPFAALGPITFWVAPVIGCTAGGKGQATVTITKKWAQKDGTRFRRGFFWEDGGDFEPRVEDFQMELVEDVTQVEGAGGLEAKCKLGIEITAEALETLNFTVGGGLAAKVEGKACTSAQTQNAVDTSLKIGLGAYAEATFSVEVPFINHTIFTRTIAEKSWDFPSPLSGYLVGDDNTCKCEDTSGDLLCK